ncbi:hypothetical protein [Pararhizobium mangrovi]|uniref:DUF4175 domain-containing protein n=1 Tax=Pararhizobium mangrovi TaxID=2590452 RepID=A0A506U061_9HYPH|nr:hypothetical protein [Pararhizobium mangrovi]TPW27713.1 hypothetical protein FJU11_10750 [Pararhizobium mangrovi]
MCIATILTIAGLGAFCWLVFNLAVYAFPFFVGMAMGLAAYHHDTGPLGAVAIGLTSGAMTLVIGQFLFAHLRSPILRIVVAIVFAVPAAIAGYHLAYGLSGIGGTGEVWRHVLGYVGAVVIGSVAWVRVGALDIDEQRQPSAPIQPLSTR